MLTDEQREYQRNWYRENIEKRRAKARENMRRWRKENPEAARAANKKWRDKNPGHLRNYLTKKLYGISPEERDAMFLRQDKRCAICRSEEHNGQGWHIDHCHTSKRVRGILCNNCNLMLGHAKDERATLIAAVDYLSV